MGDKPSIKQIQAEESGNSDGDGGGDGGDGGSGGTSGLSLDSLGLSRKHALIIGVIVLALLAWKMKSDGGKTTAADEVENVRNGPDLGDVTVTEDEEQDEVEVVVPANPDDELEKDAAVIDALKDGGHIEGDGD